MCGFIFASICFHIRYNVKMIIYGKVPNSHLRAIDYFGDKLFSRQLCQHLHIQVKYKKTDKHWGITFVEECNKRGYPRQFVIEVNRALNEKEKLMTFAHELVHVKQFATLELNEEMNIWKGEYINSDVVPYHEQPWEIEAYDVGDKLFGEYYGNV